MSTVSTQRTPTSSIGGGDVRPPEGSYFNNLFGPDGQPVNADLRRMLTQAGTATLDVVRFTDETETFYAIGCWANKRQARPPACRHTGYAARLVARYDTQDRRELLPLVASLLAVAAPYVPARPLGKALCFLDPWLVLRALPAQARRRGPCVVQGFASPHRPESPVVRGLRRKLAETEARLAEVKKLKPTALARVGLPTSPQPFWLSLPVGAETLALVKQQLSAQLAELRQRLTTHD